MRILIVGAEGTVGQCAVNELGRRHEIITAGRTSGGIRVDLMDEASIARMFDTAGQLDAIIAATGHTHFGPLSTMTPALFRKGLDDKLMGQINLVFIGLDKLNDGGSFTLTAGVTNRDPIRSGTASSAVNGALEGFVKSAAIEMPRGLRINAISPGLLDASAVKYDGFFPGHVPVSSARVGMAYAKSVEGAITGTTIAVD